jgi:hypothetical protein
MKPRNVISAYLMSGHLRHGVVSRRVTPRYLRNDAIEAARDRCPAKTVFR